MAWSHRKNARHRISKKDVVRKAVCNKTKRKTKNKMAGWRVHGPEKDGNKRMERQSKGSRGLEAYCKGGQGPPRAVAPPKKKKFHLLTVAAEPVKDLRQYSTYYIDIKIFNILPGKLMKYCMRNGYNTSYYIFCVFVLLCISVTYSTLLPPGVNFESMERITHL